MRTIIYLLAMLFLASCTNQTQIVTSPDGAVTVKIITDNNVLQYSVNFHDKQVVLPSSLGFKFANQPDLLGPFILQKTERRNVDETWKPVWGFDSMIHNHFNELRLFFKEKLEPQRRFVLVFRVYDDGVGFRYEFRQQANMDKVAIISEETQFRLPGGMAWWIPGDYESYEFLYNHTPLAKIDSANTPVTIELKTGPVISIHEAALYDYADMTLTHAGKDSALFKSKLVPWPDGIKVKTKTPFRTPWRVIMIGAHAGDLMESHLIQNLNEPNKIKDTSWIHPVKYVGIWWGMHIGKWSWYYGPKHGATTERTKQYIDFASTHHIPGVLVEGWNKGWKTWLKGKNVQDYLKPYPDYDLKFLADYAKKKGVFLIGHHESGGNIPSYEEQIEEAFSLCEHLGIPAVKTGYAGKIHPEGMHHHGQWMVRHYQKVVEVAARHHIMIDAHEPIKDTGISRTWPNFLSREGARGMEYNAWSDGNPPEHTLILPFTRFLSGPMDYTPGIFNLKFEDNGKHRVYTTLAKQLAYYVTLYSPFQMAADLIENYENQPAFKFIEDVPVNWDETRVLKAKIGDYLTVARRKGQNWYVGSITDEKARHWKISLKFLKQGQTYKALIFTDALNTDWVNNPTTIEIGAYRVTADDSLCVMLSPSGGQAVEMLAAQPEDVRDLKPISTFNQAQKKKIKPFDAVPVYRKN